MMKTTMNSVFTRGMGTISIRDLHKRVHNQWFRRRRVKEKGEIIFKPFSDLKSYIDDKLHHKKIIQDLYETID